MAGESRRQREHEKQLERDKRYRAKRKKEREQLRVTDKELSAIRRSKKRYNKGENSEIADRGLADLKRRFRRLWAEQKDSEYHDKEPNGKLPFETFELEALKPRGEFQRLWNNLLRAGRNNDKDAFRRVITAMGFYRMGDLALGRYWASFTAVIREPEGEE